PAAPKSGQILGAIQILSGGNAGKELELAKPLTTLGKPGVQVAVLTRRPQGYFITHVEGAKQPTVNGQSIGAAPHMLKDHDLIEIAGVKMEYFVKG
ncbi:MAG: FHA domain-containing protein, partial [Burkholderiales bacterium]